MKWGLSVHSSRDRRLRGCRNTVIDNLGMVHISHRLYRLPVLHNKNKYRDVLN